MSRTEDSKRLYKCLCGCGKMTESGGCDEAWRMFTKAYSEPLDDKELVDLK